MNTLFLGLMYNISKEDELIKENPIGIGIASNILQHNIVKSIFERDNIKISGITSLPVGNFPKLSKKIYYASNNYEIFNSVKINEISTINFFIIKHLIRKINLKKEFQCWYQQNEKSNNKTIIIYDLYEPFLTTGIWVKNKYPDVKVILVIPDLVGKLRNKSNSLFFIQTILNYKSAGILNKANSFDGYILLSEGMKKQIDIKNKPYLIINGLVDEEDTTKKLNFNQNKRIFLYSGSLNSQYHVDKMVHEFLENKNFDRELWLCGSGELAESIKKIANENINIKYFGLVTKKTARKLEHKADVLINPRPNNGLYTQYSFPSKNLEFLLSGKPVVCYKLDSFGTKFDGIFDYIDPKLSLPFDNIYNKYSNMSVKELEKIGDKNREFVIANFDVKVHGENIDNLIQEIWKNSVI